MTRFDPKAIVVAMLLALALNVIGGMLLLALFSSGLDEGMSSDQAGAAVQAILQDTGFLLASLICSAVTTAIGGHVAARLARAYPYFNALAVGLLCLALGLLLSTDAPWWVTLIDDLAAVPAALLGAHLARQRNQ
jgi:tetrahydromethanopterin S-methyltransferase subunit C